MIIDVKNKSLINTAKKSVCVCVCVCVCALQIWPIQYGDDIYCFFQSVCWLARLFKYKYVRDRSTQSLFHKPHSLTQTTKSMMTYRGSGVLFFLWQRHGGPPAIATRNLPRRARPFVRSRRFVLEVGNTPVTERQWVHH